MKRYMLALLLLTGCSSFTPVIVGPPDVKASVQAAVAATQTALPTRTPYPTYTSLPSFTPTPSVTPVQEPATAPASIATLAAQVARLEEHSAQQDTFLSYIATRVDALVMEQRGAALDQTPTPPPPPTPAPVFTPTPAVVNGWVTYVNEAFKLSLQVPITMSPPVVPGEAPYFIFGSQITLLITPGNPITQLQRSQINERVDQVTIAGVHATRLQGHISSGGRRIPQQFVQFVVQHGNLYYTFTLYALSVNQKSGAVDVIHPLKSEDAALFEQIMHTVSFMD